ncbi:MAG TPA: hypothetical protein VGK41_05515 [Solirubrobacterales bacterium]
MSEPYIPFATFRPIDVWPGKLLEQTERRYSQFSASWASTLELLKREIAMIDGERVIVQMALRENQIRRDGFPRSEARPEHPGVILAFDSKHGPLKYATDRFTKWEDNIRAIALGLESLRAVDRYGITKRGEQYSGWKQLTAGPASDPELVARGREVIAEHGGSVRAALKATHPDAGGDEDDFKAVSAANEASGGRL